MANFELEYTSRAQRDLNKFDLPTKQKIVQESLGLEEDPRPYRDRKKKIKNIKFPCYRLRIDFGGQTYRLFYGIDRSKVYVLRIVSRKDADRIIKKLRR